MFEQLPLPFLSLIFLATGAVVWIAGVYVSKTTDVLSSRFKLGEALGGAILLAIVTNLPEIAITISGALRNQIGIATGNILGGIAIQTVVLVVLDFLGTGKKMPLIGHAASLDLVLEAVLVVVMLAVVVMGHQLPDTLVWHGITPDAVVICIAWIAGLYLIGKARGNLPGRAAATRPEDNRGGRRGKKRKRRKDKKRARH